MGHRDEPRGNHRQHLHAIGHASDRDHRVQIEVPKLTHPLYALVQPTMTTVHITRLRKLALAALATIIALLTLNLLAFVSCCTRSRSIRWDIAALNC